MTFPVLRRNDVYRHYDHRIKLMIHKTKNPNLFPELDIPWSTALTWIKNIPADIVTLASFDQTNDKIIIENRNLQNEIDTLKTKLDLTLKTFSIFGFLPVAIITVFD